MTGAPVVRRADLQVCRSGKPKGLPYVLILLTAAAVVSAQRSGNPILTGWYAVPEAHVFGDKYWIYPTYSAPYGEQTFLDAFSSPDLTTWTRHPRILDTERVTWATRAVWAPSIVEKNGSYF